MTNSLLPSPRENLSDKDSRAYILVSYSMYYPLLLSKLSGEYRRGRAGGWDSKTIAAGENSECSFGGFILMM